MFCEYESNFFLERRYIHMLQVNEIFIEMLLRQRCLSKKYGNAFPRQKKVWKLEMATAQRTRPRAVVSVPGSVAT